MTAIRLRLKCAGKEPGVEDVALLLTRAAATLKLPAVQVKAGAVKPVQRTHLLITGVFMCLNLSCRQSRPSWLS